MRRPSFLVTWTVLFTAVVLAWLVAAGWAVWGSLEPSSRASLLPLLGGAPAIAVLFVLLLPAVLAALLAPWARRYPASAARMADAVDIIAASNPAHRVAEDGGPELRQLARGINGLADRHAALQGDIQRQVADAQDRLAQETVRLAALMAELPQGVLVCSAQGEVLLYNGQASRLLAGGDAPLGLGRPVAQLLDGGAVAHALEQVRAQRRQGAAHPVAHVVVSRRGADARGGHLLRAQLVPLRGAATRAAGTEAPDDIDGYLLILQDITRQVEDATRRDRALLDLTEGSRSALASLRAAAEMLHARPDMEAALRQRFTQVIHDEAQGLSRRLEETLSRGVDPLAGAWPREDMRVADLAAALQRTLASSSVDLVLASDGPAVWLRLDSHALVQAFAHLAAQVRAASDQAALQLRWSRQGPFVALDLLWPGLPLQAGLLAQWEGQPFAVGEQGVEVTLHEVLQRHGAEAWTLGAVAAGQEGLAGIRVQMSAAEDVADPGTDASAPSRPVYYDFSLLQRRGAGSALHDRALADLTFTVFDTETTGLQPSEGDEIISIGAYRIVNGRLLMQECFERLIEPRRPVRASAQAVHGITPDMLAGQPPAETVLPAFARFCGGSVLVAHNAAFDLRFLELARERTGAAFDQPVLDTLLLSSILHPGHGGGEHRLEAIAGRLGITVVGRHTAAGDAQVTGEVFLRMLPLLQARGILTLGQALAASEQSGYAQLRY
ncbi:MAG: exonuclease domain-containing protein [Aquabacterium sp.]